jgi:hypothetical protein
MKPTGRANKPERNLSSAIRGALTDSGLDLETKIFSESGRGRTFFLTSLFIELICRRVFRYRWGRRLDSSLQRCPDSARSDHSPEFERTTAGIVTVSGDFFCLGNRQGDYRKASPSMICTACPPTRTFEMLVPLLLDLTKSLLGPLDFDSLQNQHGFIGLGNAVLNHPSRSASCG